MINSKLKLKLITQEHSTPLAWNCQLSLQTQLLLHMTKLMLISSNGHFSSHLKNIQLYHNLPSTYLLLPYKETHFFRFKNVWMSYFLPSDNNCQQTRAVRHTNISQMIIIRYIYLSSQWTPILNFYRERKLWSILQSTC